MARSRYAGSAEDLAAIVAPWANSPGWLKYDETDKVASARLDSAAAVRHKGLLAALHRAQHNLSFPKTLMYEAFKVVVSQRPEWGLSEPDALDWAETMARRLRNMCRGVHQSCVRSKPPSWTSALAWMGRVEEAKAALCETYWRACSYPDILMLISSSIILARQFELSSQGVRFERGPHLKLSQCGTIHDSVNHLFSKSATQIVEIFALQCTVSGIVRFDWLQF